LKKLRRALYAPSILLLQNDAGDLDMRVLIDALSVTHMSARHVLLGHLRKLAGWTRDNHHFIVLHHQANRNIVTNLGKNVEWVECPGYTSYLINRMLWERVMLPGILRSKRIDCLFIPSGIVMRGCRVPQVSLAQNPWCLVKGIDRTSSGVIKATIQRHEYRVAMRKAAMMVFNSEYMRSAYHENAGFDARCSEIVYQGIDEGVFDEAVRLRSSAMRKDNSILCVSAMAPHKGVITLVKAVDRLKRYYKVPAKLFLVGPWSDVKYKKSVQQCIMSLNLENSVDIEGYVTRERLHRYYNESKVFCLMSTCESFGIPAVEAQAFGTPVVSSNCCAIPEVCGKGGVYPEAKDVEATAAALAELLTNRIAWETHSEAGHRNAERFHWDTCSKPLMRMFDVVTEGLS
jgi:glycosyltransferase involved in cell wall biosynthesis